MWYRNLLKVTQLARIDYELKPKTIQNEICFLNNAFLRCFSLWEGKIWKGLFVTLLKEQVLFF